MTVANATRPCRRRLDRLGIDRRAQPPCATQRRARSSMGLFHVKRPAPHTGALAMENSEVVQEAGGLHEEPAVPSLRPLLSCELAVC